jgi:hypothetical protein
MAVADMKIMVRPCLVKKRAAAGWLGLLLLTTNCTRNEAQFELPKAEEMCISIVLGNTITIQAEKALHREDNHCRPAATICIGRS